MEIISCLIHEIGMVYPFIDWKNWELTTLILMFDKTQDWKLYYWFSFYNI